MNAESQTRLIEIDWRPSSVKLRQFALCLAVVLIVVAWYRGPGWPLCIAAVLIGMLSLLWPKLLRPVYVLVTMLTLPLGMVIGELALLFIYALVFVPIGLLFRLMKRDALHRELDRDGVSYWEECPAEPPKKSYLRRY